MSKNVNRILVLLMGGILLQTFACKHDPFIPEDDMNPVDTTMNPIDTTANPIDTTGNPVDTMGMPCDPELIYFERDILPLLNSNCAFAGCHDAASAQDGVNLSTYESVIQTADIQPFDLEDSELYEVITDTDPDKRMPPPPNSALNSEQINLIARWILEGAENLSCDPNASGCDTEAVSYMNTLLPILQTNCIGCHSGSAPSGGISLNTHSGVQSVSLNGRLIGAISHAPNYSAMPQGGAKLDDCSIAKFQAWIDAGAPEN